MSINCNVSAQIDTISIVEDKTPVAESVVIKKIHSPHKASLYSAVLPGLGQAYNRQYYKIPLIYAGLVGITYAIKYNSDKYYLYKQGYRDYLIQDPQNESYLEIIEGTNISPDDIAVGGKWGTWFENTLKNGKNYYERWRNLSYVGFAVIYVLNIIDASVYAHFKTFDVSNDLSMTIDPYVDPGYGGYNSVGLQLKIVF